MCAGVTNRDYERLADLYPKQFLALLVPPRRKRECKQFTHADLTDGRSKPGSAQTELRVDRGGDFAVYPGRVKNDVRVKEDSA